MDKQIRSKHISAISLGSYQMAVDFQTGLPLALYTMSPHLLRKEKRGSLMLLIVAICLFLAGYLSILNQAISPGNQIIPLPNALFNSLAVLTGGLIAGLGAIAQMWIVADMLPKSVLVCTEGLLLIRPKKIEVTRWKEVTAFRFVQVTPKKKGYQLSRLNHRSLNFFADEWENIEDLADLLRKLISNHPSPEINQ